MAVAFLVDVKGMPDSCQITDCYALGLAVSRQGSFVTLDQDVDASSIAEGARAFFDFLKPEP